MAELIRLMKGDKSPPSITKAINGMCGVKAMPAPLREGVGVLARVTLVVQVDVSGPLRNCYENGCKRKS